MLTSGAVYNRCKKAPDFAHFCPINGMGTIQFMPNQPPIDIENPLISVFAGGGVDRFLTWFMKPDSKTPSGYYIKDDTFNIQAELINYLQKAQTVYLTLDYEYMEGRYGRDSMVTLLAVTGCSQNAGWVSKTARSVTKSGEFPVYQNGTIINMRGHLHDGGVSIELFINNQSICNSKAEYGGKEGSFTDDSGKVWESISKMSTCEDSIKVTKGDKISMVAYYDTELHPL
jgi:hypothetical protein